jgi:hypothetical protein
MSEMCYDCRVRPHKEVDNPILTADHVDDVPNAYFVADPFLVTSADEYHLFFEVAATPNVVAHATSTNGTTWTYDQVVLRGDFNLSFPYVFSSDGTWYMIPSISPKKGGLHIYRAQKFPTEWKRVDTAFADTPVIDPVVFRWCEKWWVIFAQNEAANTIKAKIRDKLGFSTPYTIHVYHSEDLIGGEWISHPSNPICSSLRTQRPAGRPLVNDDHVGLFFQDWVERGAHGVRHFRVRELTEKKYDHVECANSPIIKAEGTGDWNHLGMHHIDCASARSVRASPVVVDGKNPNSNWGIGLYEFRQ